jgi:gamma-glutamyltranspeptidase / glutathione hydrolase
MTLRYDRRSFLAVTGGALATAAARQAIGAEHLPKGHGLVVGHPEANEAGMKVLADGGNAVDAIVAAALVAGVVAVSRCGIGGYGGHMTIGLPTGKVTSIDFNSEAPAATRPDMFPLDAKGNVKGAVNVNGWLAAGVPGTLAGLQLALDKYGTKPFSQLVRPAIQCARDGFEVFWALGPFAPRMLRDPGSAKLFFRNGKPLAKGDTYRNPDLADMLQQLAEKGSANDFYQGEIGRKIAAAFKKNGGIVTADDMANYRAVEDSPLVLDWRGQSIATAPLTAGGLTVLQTIATLKTMEVEWSKLAKTDPRYTQMWLEALRIAWGDRLQLFGDRKYVDVPVERMLSEKYAVESAKKVRAAVAEKRPVPVATDGRTAGGTTNLSAVDSAGMMAAITLTHGGSFGSQVTVDGLGLILGHGMSRFEPAPGKANSIAPGKRPLDNMCPTIVSQGGKPTLAIGAVGGRRIPSVIFEVLMGLIAEGRSLEDAMTTPRLTTEGDKVLLVEPGWPEAKLQYLKQVGYKIDKAVLCWASAVQIDPAKKGRPPIGVEDIAPKKGGGDRNPQPMVIK